MGKHKIETVYLDAKIEIVSLVSEGEVRALRRAFHNKKKKQFTDACFEICLAGTRGAERNALLGQLRTFEKHHILPLSFGGTNDFENLVLIDPKLHLQIHQLMAIFTRRQQCHVAGSSVYLPVPRHPQKERIWGLNYTFIRVEDFDLAA
jgi:hypothetical protein